MISICTSGSHWYVGHNYWCDEYVNHFMKYWCKHRFSWGIFFIFLHYSVPMQGSFLPRGSANERRCNIVISWGIFFIFLHYSVPMQGSFLPRGSANERRCNIVISSLIGELIPRMIPAILFQLSSYFVLFLCFFIFFFKLIVIWGVCVIYAREDNDSNVEVMIIQLTWT